MQTKKGRNNHSDFSNHSLRNFEMDMIDINKLFEEAVSYFNQSSQEDLIKKACYMFQKVIEKDPEFRTHNGGHSDNPYFYIGRYYEYYLTDWDTAIDYYTKSIELCPDDYGSYECRGICLLQTNQFELALEDFRIAKELKNNDDEGEMLPGLDGLIIEVENRLSGGIPEKKYDGYFNEV